MNGVTVTSTSAVRRMSLVWMPMVVTPSALAVMTPSELTVATSGLVLYQVIFLLPQSSGVKIICKLYVLVSGRLSVGTSKLTLSTCTKCGGVSSFSIQDESDKTAVNAVNRQKNLFISVSLG